MMKVKQIMKVKQLIAKLLKMDQNLEVELEVDLDHRAVLDSVELSNNVDCIFDGEPPIQNIVLLVGEN